MPRDDHILVLTLTLPSLFAQWLGALGAKQGNTSACVCVRVRVGVEGGERR